MQKVAASLGRRAPADLKQRMASCSADDRSAMARAFAAADAVLPAEIRKVHGPVDVTVREQLRDKGCCDLGRLLSASQVDDVRKHLEARPTLVGRAPSHWDKPAASLENVPRDENYACYSYLDLWSSPHVLELATQDRLLDLVQGYLECTPTLCSLNAFWALPERKADPQYQAFHRDLKDCRSLTVFTLLTPVEVPEEGAYVHVDGSHDVPMLEASLRAEGVRTNVDYLMAGTFVAPLTTRLFHRTARRFHGPAGASLCADTFALNRWLVPRSRPQLVLEMRFGTFFNELAYDMTLGRDNSRRFRRVVRLATAAFDRSRGRRLRGVLQRIPATPRHRYIFRYLTQALAAEL